MISDERFYARRAAQELSRASRALTQEAREWHQQLAESFARRARGGDLQLVGNEAGES